MPVSRKRKKKSKSGGQPARSQRSALDGLSRMLEQRRRIDEHRMRVAGPVAAGMVADLVEFATHASDADLEDALCVRFGRQVFAWDNGGVLDDMVGPDQLLIALAEAAASAVRTALVTPVGWRGPWRVLTVVCHLAAGPPQVVIDGLFADLRELSEVPTLPEGSVLPEVPAGPTPTGRVLWARNRYGSRFCVLAEVSVGEGLSRWYLWDIDACGREPVGVHGAYHPSVEVGLAEWRAVVGETAGDAILTPVDDLTLLVELLPLPEGPVRYGGEDADLLAEYHRSRRLALELLETFDPAGFVPVESLAASAAEEFLAWLRVRRPDAVAEPVDDEGDDEPVELEDLAAELAESWCSSGVPAIYHACSPHRLAQVVPLVRNFYREPFAGRLVELLPAWSDWLAERNGTPLELTERCRPYANATGAPDAGPLSGEDPDRYARVRE